MELVRVPVSSVSLGRTRFVVQAGTGVTGLAADFLVATVGANDPLFGGDYAQATVELEVRSASLCEPVLRISLLPGGAQARVMFTPCPGRTHTLEHRTTLGRTTEWQAVTGAPHNSGEVTVDVTGAQDFFRLRVGP